MSGLGNYTSKRAENENPIPHTFSFLQARQTLPRGLRWADWRLAVALIAARRLAGAVEEGAPASEEAGLLGRGGRSEPTSTSLSSPPAEASDGRALTLSMSSMTALVYGKIKPRQYLDSKPAGPSGKARNTGTNA